MIQIDLVSRYNKLRVDFNAESRAVLWRSLYEGWLLRLRQCDVFESEIWVELLYNQILTLIQFDVDETVKFVPLKTVLECCVCAESPVRNNY